MNQYNEFSNENNANLSWIRRKEKALPNSFKLQFPCIIEKAKNAEIWDKSGNKYIDFAGGIAVMNVGHSNPKVLDAVSKQLQKFQHTCFPVLPYARYIELAEMMNTIVPGNFTKKTFFLNSGAEAIENAVKAARFYTKRRAVISFAGSFHGRTSLAMSLTGKILPYKDGFTQSGNDVYHVPFPAKTLGVTVDDSLKAIKNLFKTTISANEVAAILIEPVQGEGGFYIAPLELIKNLRLICDQHGILLIIDEVQTGFARTGKFMAFEHFQTPDEIEFDIMTFAKSIAAGFPLSGVTARSKILDSVHAGGFGSTYGGNPLSIEAAIAVINIINEESLLRRSVELGHKIISELKTINTNIISDIRGIGSMVAVEFDDPTGSFKGDEFAKAVQKSAFRKGLMLLTCGVNYNVIRFLYPLTIEDHVFDEGISILKESINNPHFED